jgi:uroporphyrinogen decarboxylase
MSDMSKRRRLEAAITGEPVDRLPVALWRHWPGDDQDAAALAAAHLKWQADYDWDVVKVGPASSYSVVDWGLQDQWEGHIEGTRKTTHLPVSSPADWAALSPLDPNKGMLAEQIKALRLVGEGLRGETPFIATVFSPLSMAKHLAGNEAVLSHLRHSPDAVTARAGDDDRKYPALYRGGAGHGHRRHLLCRAARRLPAAEPGRV